MSNNIGCLGILAVIAFVLTIAVIVGLIITKIIIWLAMGLFNCDLSDKFWYIFVAYMVVLPMIKGIFRVNVNKG